MRKTIIGARVLLFLLAWPCGAMATALETPDAAPPPHFIPLESARTSQHGVTVTRPMPLRSDSQALRQGFMRIDRSAGKPIAIDRSAPMIVRPASPTAAATGVIVTRPDSGPAPSATGPVNPTDPEAGDTERPGVLGLFDDGAAPPLSFAEAMRGRIASVLGTKQGWPLPPGIPQQLTSGFGMRSDPFTHRPAFHGGIDIAAASGTPVLSTAAGTVGRVGEDAHYGRYVSILNRDGSESHYGHLSAYTVRDGQVVAAGQPIGAVGQTGRATGPHLDYRISKNGARLDPLSILTPPAAALRVVAR